MGKLYAYYFCQQKKCDQYGKTIPRDKIEGEFAALLQTVQPTPTLFQVAASMFKAAWDKQGEILAATAKQCTQEIATLEKDINAVVSRIMEATNPRVISAYETRIEEMENRKLLLMEKTQNAGQPVHSFRQMFELSMQFVFASLRVSQTLRSSGIQADLTCKEWCYPRGRRSQNWCFVSVWCIADP
jgi:site-specific DNA recombinase